MARKKAVKDQLTLWLFNPTNIVDELISKQYHNYLNKSDLGRLSKYKCLDCGKILDSYFEVNLHIKYEEGREW